MSIPLNRFPKSLLCLLYGGLVPLGFAPFNYFIFPILSLSLLFYSWLNTSPRQAFLCGYFFGLGMFAFGVNWLHISINLFGGANLVSSIFITFLLVSFYAIFPALVGYASRRYFPCSTVSNLILTTPALWIVSEWLRSLGVIAFPWLHLAYSQIDSPYGSFAPVVGVYGTGWITVVSAALLVSLFVLRSRKSMLALISLLLIYASSYLLKDKQWTDPKGVDISVVLVQGGIPQELKWKPEYRQSSLDLYKSLSDPYWGSDLIIWPETAIPSYYHLALNFIEELKSISRANSSELLAGILIKNLKTGEYYNSAILIGNTTDNYHKRRLVPFGEYLPLDALVRPILNILQIPMSDFSSGSQHKTILAGSNFNAGISICYEDVFGQQVIQALPKADILVNISNDAWFGNSVAPHQHLQMARMRALETGRFMLRATNTGITAIVDNTGKIVRQSKQFEANSIHAKVPLFQGQTPYSRFGDTPIIITMLLILTGVNRKVILKRFKS